MPDLRGLLLVSARAEAIWGHMFTQRYCRKRKEKKIIPIHAMDDVNNRKSELTHNQQTINHPSINTVRENKICCQTSTPTSPHPRKKFLLLDLVHALQRHIFAKHLIF